MDDASLVENGLVFILYHGNLRMAGTTDGPQIADIGEFTQNHRIFRKNRYESLRFVGKIASSLLVGKKSITARMSGAEFGRACLQFVIASDAKQPPVSFAHDTLRRPVFMIFGQTRDHFAAKSLLAMKSRDYS